MRTRSIEYVLEVFNNQGELLLRKSTPNPAYIEEAIGRVERHLPEWRDYTLTLVVDGDACAERWGNNPEQDTNDMLSHLDDLEQVAEKFEPEYLSMIYD